MFSKETKTQWKRKKKPAKPSPNWQQGAAGEKAQAHGLPGKAGKLPAGGALGLPGLLLLGGSLPALSLADQAREGGDEKWVSLWVLHF